MIYLGSRYENADVQYVLDGRSLTTRPTALRGPQPMFPASEIYRWRQGDRVDLVGKAFSQRASLWWTIFDNDPENIDPLSLTPGKVVVVR